MKHEMKIKISESLERRGNQGNIESLERRGNLEKDLLIGQASIVVFQKIEDEELAEAEDLEEAQEEVVQLMQMCKEVIFGPRLDVSKRKRNKSLVPSSERCLALRSCSEQCSRRRNVSSCFCGTHTKGIPHGSLSSENVSAESPENVS